MPLDFVKFTHWLCLQYEYKGDGTKKPEKGKKKKKKDKVSDDEGEGEVETSVTPAETKGKKKRLVDGKDSQGESDRWVQFFIHSILLFLSDNVYFDMMFLVERYIHQRRNFFVYGLHQKLLFQGTETKTYVW